jgi:hypothetical protein
MIREETSSMPSFIPLMLRESLPAELRIVELKGCSMQSKAAIVRLNKISTKGLRFSSELLFPINPHIILNFRVTILNETINLKGTINWSQNENSLNLYEVVFIKNEQTKAKLISLLNSLMRQYKPLQLRAEYYYNYFSESTYDFNNSRINLLR